MNKQILNSSHAGEIEAARACVAPQPFSCAGLSRSIGNYGEDGALRALVEFFERKGLPALKQEDREERWYADWIAYQAEHGIYAALLTPAEHSTDGARFDLLRYARFLEVFGYFSPAHGYSLQVTFLGFFAILMGDNEALKREAVAALANGGLLAFGVSEKSHGADLLGNEFTVKQLQDGCLRASGEKYYIGNANSAAIVAVLAKLIRAGVSGRRAPLILFALRPGETTAFADLRKIQTLGVRSAFVGEFAVRDRELAAGDVIAEGRQVWDAVFGTVTLGKFFLGFGSIGICEHALHEAVTHLAARILYGKPAIEMPHLRATLAAAYARLSAMKLYAYRALDYVHAASAADRRYLLFTAVQKARVSTEGVKVMALLSECIGAKSFEADTYFEMALRDIQLIPGLEGSTHINLAQAMQLMPCYFAGADINLPGPVSQMLENSRRENAYLFEARAGALHSISFPHFLRAYRPLIGISNVRAFAKQVKAFQLFVRANGDLGSAGPDSPLTMAAGNCIAIVTYAQLVAENAALLDLPASLISAVFHALIQDFSTAALTLAGCPGAPAIPAASLRRMVSAPKTTEADWEFVGARMVELADSPASRAT